MRTYEVEPIAAGRARSALARTSRQNTAADVLLQLQRLVGNATVCALLVDRRRGTVQRCGAVPCDCPSEKRAVHATVHRFAGNTAVTRAMADWKINTAAVIQRFSGFEHEMLGNVTGASVDLGHGVILSWGQVVAIAGDEYGSVEELRGAMRTLEGRARLRSRLEHDEVRGPIPASLPHEDSKTKSNARFIELAMHNVQHFAAGGTALETWRSHHEHALMSAILSGLNDDAAEWQNAQLTEAFGQHYLTDSFSAGHVRTPRAAIMAWYQNDFAPRALGPFLAFARERVTRALTDDLGRQMLAPNIAVRAAFDTALRAVLAALDGMIRERGQSLFGLAISGAISGALHDRDNERGVWVASEAHPAPWMAFGDNRLACSPESRQQAELAVLTAREQLVQAQALGQIRREHRGASPAPPGQTGAPGDAPGVVHFAFDSSELDSATMAALDRTADYLTAHPEQVVDVIGHTDPLGTDEYNDGLGMRRAEAVAARLMRRGVAPNRISFASAGERQLVAGNVAGYPADRRAELHYRATDAEPPDLVWAQQALGERFGLPPYQAVERFVPRAVPEFNDPQEDWQWGSLTSDMAAEVDRWIAHYVGDFKPSVLANPALADRTLPVPDLGPPMFPGAPPVMPHPVTLHPRPAVEALLNEVIASPTDFVGIMVGMPAANRSTEPLPPATPCVPQAAP